MHARQLLLIRSSQPENAYGRFAGEILRAEGLNGFETLDLDAGPFPDLGAGDLVLLTRCFLRWAEADALRAAVESGARVVCLQPAASTAKRFGWETTASVLYPGWVRISHDGTAASFPIQAHVPIAACEPSAEVVEYESLADGVNPDWSDGGCPAVVRQRVGKGEIVLFFYDLPEAVARIRFGNPDLASYLTTGQWKWPHACDLFTGHVDDRVLRVPQADLHCQLLADALTDISPYPLCRLWYYPEARYRTAAVFQSDGDGSTPEQFRELSDTVLSHGGAVTFYLMRHTLLGEADVAQLRAKGHTFGPHVYGNDGVDELYFRFADAMAEECELFEERFGERSVSLQCHCAPWLGYMSWMPLHVRHGYRLLFAFLSVPGERLNGYMCGSGRALRFCDRDGTVYDCWQQPVNTYDDSSLKERIGNHPEEVAAEFESLLRASLDQHHSAIAILSHPVSYCTYSKPAVDAYLDLLTAEGVPIYNGDEWCAFLDRRDAVRTEQTPCDGGGVSCTVSGLAGRVSLIIPAPDAEVTVDGRPVEPLAVERLGRRYLMVDLDSDGAADIHVDAELS